MPRRVYNYLVGTVNIFQYKSVRNLNSGEFALRIRCNVSPIQEITLKPEDWTEAYVVVSLASFKDGLRQTPWHANPEGQRDDSSRSSASNGGAATHRAAPSDLTDACCRCLAVSIRFRSGQSKRHHRARDFHRRTVPFPRARRRRRATTAGREPGGMRSVSHSDITWEH